MVSTDEQSLTSRRRDEPDAVRGEAEIDIGTSDPPSARVRLVRTLAGVGPLAAAVVVGKTLLDYLPESLSGDAARYPLALVSAVGAGVFVAWTTSLVRRRRSPAPQEGSQVPSRQEATGGRGSGSVLRRSLHDTFKASQEALLSHIATYDDPLLGSLVGWPHFFEPLDVKFGGPGAPNERIMPERPTAVGTTYGLKACLLVGTLDRRFDPDRLVETLWKLQLPSGGWAASTQHGFGRPEVTSWVLSVLSRAGGDHTPMAAALASLDRMIDPAADPVGLSRTHVVATALSGLCQANPASPHLVMLRQRLLEGAGRDRTRENLLCWGERLMTYDRNDPVPSVAHTARAIIALKRVEGFAGRDYRAHAAVEEATRWLVLNGRLDNQTEQILRTLPDYRKEAIIIRHFTAAWMVRALLSSGIELEDDVCDLLYRAVNRVWELQTDGVWEWDNRDRPLWMTYQGLRALHSYAIRSYGPPA
jgi:hypothetical protein